MLDTGLINKFNKELRKANVIQQDLSDQDSDEDVQIEEMNSGETISMAGKILGAFKVEDAHTFLIVWPDKDGDVELVSAKDANIKYPQLVIEFYEKHIMFVRKNNFPHIQNQKSSENV